MLNLHMHTTSSKMKFFGEVQRCPAHPFITYPGLKNNENKACLKHAECLILLQQDDNEDGTNFINIFVFAYNLL